MKHIFLNLKRFDVPVSYGGVNRIAPMQEWGSFIVKNTQDALKKYDPREVEFVQYLPEAHLLNAVAARCENSPVQIGCQSVYRMNTAVGGNFGAFTTNRPVSAMKACGVNATIIGHCEERNDKVGILAEAGVADTKAVNRILNREIRLAVENGMTVLYCIGERTPNWIAGTRFCGSSWRSAWTAWTKRRWSLATNPSGPSARGKRRPGRNISPRSPGSSRRSPAGSMWSTAAA